MSKKLIGIVPSLNNNMGIPRAYYEFFRQYGNVITVPMEKGAVLPVDLLVLPGGADVDASRYNPDKIYSWGSNPNRFFEFFDRQILPDYVEAVQGGEVGGIFGICRGLQTLNVHFGGTLYQHLHDEPTSEEYKRGDLVHDCVVHNSADITTGKTIKVNSLHHQAIRDLGEGLVPILVNKHKTSATEEEFKVNLIEGFRHKELPIFGVQYHPEEIYDYFSDYVLKFIFRK